MRVLYFTEKDSPHDRRFLTALAGTPHQVYALRQTRCNPETPKGIVELEWTAEQPDWSDWRGWQSGKAQFEDILAKVQPDLVHAGPVQGPALLTALEGFHPLVTMSWGFDLLVHAKRSPWMHLATKYTLERTDVLLSDCQTVTDEALSYGFSSDKIVSFPWGVDLSHFSPENSKAAGLLLRKVLGWEDKFIIFCNRTWSPRYGVDVLAKAFVDAVDVNQDLRLLLAGDGPQSNLIKRILALAGERISFPGWLDLESLPGAYGAADLFVSPSHSDGSSISLLEAMACGRPVLVSDIPSNREWVTPGEAGYLFKDGDVMSLKEKILKMAGDPKPDRFGQCARELAEGRADWEKNFQKLLFAYQLAK